MEDPVGVEVMDAIQDLVEQRLDHSSRQLKWLFVGLGRSVELNNVLQKDKIIVIVVCAHIMTEIHHFVPFIQSQMYVYATGKMSKADICGMCFHFLG